jgi:apolipoprotein N-acyltransferase
MREAVSTASGLNGRCEPAVSARAQSSGLTSWAAAIVSAVLLVFSFPDFNLWPLAWLALVPLLVMVAHRPAPGRSFLIGWFAGTAFFYGSCYWLTYSMIHYGGIPPWSAYLLLVPGALTLGLFPGLFALILARLIRKWRTEFLFAAPLIWVSLEWARLQLTGQLWNAIGYSHAYQPFFIQSARWGGVYLVGFFIVFVNTAVAFLILQRNKRAAVMTGLMCCIMAIVSLAFYKASPASPDITNSPDLLVVAIQPNVPMAFVKSADEMRQLTSRHLAMSEDALKQLGDEATPRLVIWPESPMNFAYGGDSQLQEILRNFARENHTAVLFNSQELAPNDGLYNSALFINQDGKLAGQYDKIRLLPFGEYVPLPRWLPGAGLITAVVGDFTPGTDYRLIPVGGTRVGVFICIESAYPSIARIFTSKGADFLINISNDGYLGPTAVMRQHLANAVFRAVENGRPLLRVTNSGITAYITPNGQVKDQTKGFETAVRTWRISRNGNADTFYSKHGDVFVVAMSTISLLLFAVSFNFRARKKPRGQVRG